MKKETAISIFGSGAELARALKITRGAVSNWPDFLSHRQTLETISAALMQNRIDAQRAVELFNEGQRDKRDKSESR